MLWTSEHKEEINTKWAASSSHYNTYVSDHSPVSSFPYLSGCYWRCLPLGSGRTGCVWHRPTCHCHFGPSWWGTGPCDCSACLCRQSAHWRRCGAACPPAYIPWTHGSPVQEKILHDYYMHYCLIKEVVIYTAIIHLW